MRKLIVIILILLSGISCLALNFSIKFTPLEDKVCDFIEKYTEPFKAKHDVLEDAVMWTAEEEAIQGKDKRYPAYLQTQYIYVYFAASDGPTIQVCYAPNIDRSHRRAPGKKWTCSKQKGDEVFIAFTPKITGEHLVMIKTLKGSGNAVGYMVYYYKKGQPKAVYQDLIYTGEEI